MTDAVGILERPVEAVGEAMGWALSPLFGAAGAVRRARALHPTGVVLSARVEALDHGNPLASSLEGPALVRFSGALWKRGDGWTRRLPLPDVLGCAVRFRTREEPGPDPEDGDQDLLFATMRHPLEVAVGVLLTDARDFLENDYFAISPFDAPGLGRGYFRLWSPTAHRGGFPFHAPRPGDEDEREERLRAGLREGRGVLRLDFAPGRFAPWTPLARLRLGEPVDVDQARLRFWPYLDGKGIVPRGFVHALRRGAYAASEAARPRSA